MSLQSLKHLFLPKKALVLRKFSRLEYERLCHPNLTEEQLSSNVSHRKQTTKLDYHLHLSKSLTYFYAHIIEHTQLSQRGSVYESLKHYDQVQKSCLQQIESVLASNNITYQTVDRFGYTEDKIDWADVIITSGGDGTFLMAASKVTTRNKPVIGVNSDPTKSVGHLCLPSKYSHNFDKVIELLKEGRYQWQYKQRLRVTLIGEVANEVPRELNDIRYNLAGTNQFLDQDDSQDQAFTARSRSPFQHALHQQLPGPSNCKYPAVLPPNSTTTSMSQTDIAPPRSHTPISSTFDHQTDSSTLTASGMQSGFDQEGRTFRTVDGRVTNKIRQLKERALNEVFVGETLSARVSYYELSVDNNRLTKMKSSGLTVCTGTGSTSWYYNINKLTEQQMHSIINIINKVTKSTKVQPNDTELIGDITRQFNETLSFPATEPIMAYSVRDPVDYATAAGHNHRGYARRIEVKSRMQNACLVLDGCQFYPFNDGSYALIEMYDEDALKTISVE